MDFIPMIVLGLCVVVVGVLTAMENPTTLHWFPCKKVQEKDMTAFARTEGGGTILAGAGMAVTAVIQMIHYEMMVWYVALIAMVLGAVVIFYGQSRYNGGIFRRKF